VVVEVRLYPQEVRLYPQGESRCSRVQELYPPFHFLKASFRYLFLMVNLLG